MQNVTHLLKNLIFKIRYGFRGAPLILGGRIFRVDESLRRWNAQGEEWMFQQMRIHLKAGDDVIDIGANFGFHSLFAAEIVGHKGRVVAFEPIPSNRKILKKNILLNGFEKSISVQESAVSDSPDKTLNMGSPNEGPNVTAAIVADCPKNGLIVENIRLDEFSWPDNFSPKMIKIDIEGAELSALRSGMKMLAGKHPILLLEIHGNLLKNFGNTLEEMEHLLKTIGYEEVSRKEVEDSKDGCYHAVFL